jgi:quercetin dioxygenase-like cupin family protein
MTKKTKITHLYTGDDGQSHFGEIEVEMEPNIAGHISELFPATGIIFREAYDYDFHVAPRKQYVVNLDGAVEITVGSGDKRVMGAGEMFLAEDTTGQGHISRAVNGKIRHSLFITLD